MPNYADGGRRSAEQRSYFGPRIVRAAALRCSLLLVVLFVVLPPSSAPVQAQTDSVLIATPPFGHPKGVFFLAGGGFVPNTPLTVNMFCPDWTFDAYGNWSWTIKVDGRGTFAGWKLHIPTPILVKGTSCVLRARRGDNPFGAAATFKIVPSDQPLQGRPFRFHIAARVVQHSGQPILLITVDAAPAAEVQLACTCASTTLAHRATQLPWNGHAVLHMPFPPSMRGTVRLMAIARLGNFVQHKSVQLTARALRAR